MNLHKFIQNIDINNDEYVIVGVSAGPDSMALLHMLKNNLKCQLVCAHINHNVRKQSDEEENFLKQYCKENNIIIETHKIKSYTKNNFENEAREKRYAFYKKILSKYHSHNLFLAHHGDDLIETVMMKIIRGSNLEGYAGIKTYSYLENYKIIRPLLSITKEDILKYNKDNNIDEWYKLTIQCDPYRYGNGEGSGDSYGYVEVEGKFEISDAGTPVDVWDNFGFLLVREYDNLNCKYDIYEEIAPAAKQLHPSYIPISAILPPVTATDNGKVLMVVDGEWKAVSLNQ
jgi:tRNA(Ile)-lysidine synthetase-like protein